MQSLQPKEIASLSTMPSAESSFVACAYQSFGKQLCLMAKLKCRTSVVPKCNMQCLRVDWPLVILQGRHSQMALASLK